MARQRNLRWRGSDFEDDGQNQRPLWCLLVEVTFQVDANLFFDDAPVGLFLWRRLLDCTDDDVAGAGDDLLAVVGTQEAAGNNFRRDAHQTGIFVNRDDRHHNSIFRQMLPVADYYLFDFFERAGVDAHAPRRHRLAFKRAAFRRKFDGLPGIQQKDFATDRTNLFGKGRVLEKLAIFAMHRNEEFWTHKLQQDFLLFLAGVSRNVNRRRASAFVVDEHVAAEKMVDHAENRFFVTRNNPR